MYMAALDRYKRHYKGGIEDGTRRDNDEHVNIQYKVCRLINGEMLETVTIGGNNAAEHPLQDQFETSSMQRDSQGKTSSERLCSGTPNARHFEEIDERGENVGARWELAIDRRIV